MGVKLSQRLDRDGAGRILPKCGLDFARFLVVYMPARDVRSSSCQVFLSNEHTRRFLFRGDHGRTVNAFSGTHVKGRHQEAPAFSCPTGKEGLIVRSATRQRDKGGWVEPAQTGFRFKPGLTVFSSPGPSGEGDGSDLLSEDGTNSVAQVVMNPEKEDSSPIYWNRSSLPVLCEKPRGIRWAHRYPSWDWPHDRGGCHDHDCAAPQLSNGRPPACSRGWKRAWSKEEFPNLTKWSVHRSLPLDPEAAKGLLDMEKRCGAPPRVVSQEGGRT